MAEQTSQFGYGTQTPEDSNDEFNLACFIIAGMIARLDTIKLVKVMNVTGGGVDQPAGTVDVMLLVNQVDGAGNSQPHGVVYGIPWTRWQGGLSAIILDPKKDDVGWVACSDRDTSVVKENNGKQSNPGSSRTYDVADGVYVGGVLNATPDQYLALLDSGFDFKDRNGNRIQTVDDASSIVVTAKGDVLIDANGGAGNLAVMGGGSFSGALEAETFNVNNGSGTITRILTGSVTTTFTGSIPAFGTRTATATVTGAKTGDVVIVARPSAGEPALVANVWGYVSSANTVTVVASNQNPNTVVPTVSGTYGILVIGLTP